jgi:hypothetical protein
LEEDVDDEQLARSEREMTATAERRMKDMS